MKIFKYKLLIRSFFYGFPGRKATRQKSTILITSLVSGLFLLSSCIAFIPVEEPGPHGHGPHHIHGRGPHNPPPPPPPPPPGRKPGPHDRHRPH